MTTTQCLNCGNDLPGAYCSGCGQKADTHRISFKNIILHDVMHGIFHIERGMLFTAKQALVRPGKAALDYISGKRKPYYNVFLLILITLGLILFSRHFYDELLVSQGGMLEHEPYLNDASRRIDEILSQKSKVIVFLFVPLAALNTFILFRRKQLNLSEHSIIAGMILLGMLLLSLFGNILFYLELVVDSDLLASIINVATPGLIILYIGYAYFNAFRRNYSVAGMTYRLLLFFALLFVESVILLYILIGFVTHWKFGTVSFSPFG